MTNTQPPATPPAGTAVAVRPRATRSDKLRLFLILGGILVFLAVVLFAVRNNQAVDELAVGTCFDVPTRTGDISTVSRHDCSEAHDAEVFHVAEFTDAKTFPISLTLDRFIGDACVPVFATYVGQAYATSNQFNLGYFYPGRDAWEKGDRTVTCYVSREDKAKLTRSIKGAGAS
jgi:hypothetical protein